MQGTAVLLLRFMSRDGAQDLNSASLESQFLLRISIHLSEFDLIAMFLFQNRLMDTSTQQGLQEQDRGELQSRKIFYPEICEIAENSALKKSRIVRILCR